MSLKERLKERLKARTEEVKTDIKRRIPLTEENQREWRERRKERKERQEKLRKIEHEARETEQEERAKRRGKESVTPPAHTRRERPSRSIGTVQTGGSRRRRGSTLRFRDPIEDIFGKPKPKQPPPQRVTRISKSGTVTITEPVKQEEEKRKKTSEISFKAPFEDLFTNGTLLGKAGKKGKAKSSQIQFKDPFDDFYGED